MCTQNGTEIDVHRPRINDSQGQHHVHQGRNRSKIRRVEKPDDFEEIGCTCKVDAQKKHSAPEQFGPEDPRHPSRHRLGQGKFEDHGFVRAHPTDGRMQQIHPILVEVPDVVGGVGLAPNMGIVQFAAEMQQPQTHEQNRGKPEPRRHKTMFSERIDVPR